MLDIHRTDSVPDTKIYFTHSTLPTYIDPQNVSTKKQPFATLNKQHFSHTLDLILPEELCALVQDKLDALCNTHYARVHMNLGELLEEEFLNTYIKQGNIMMLSEGRTLIDNRFELYEGILKMELDRQTYERCGLHGTPIEDGGKKHQKQRWIVTFDLRSESMKHGKKGFSRLEWACKNVLDRSLTWLWYNFNPGSEEALKEGREVISKHSPWIQGLEASISRLSGVLAPKIETTKLGDLYGEEEALDLLEWLHLLSLESPRVLEKDNINSHLSRYSVPDLGSGLVSQDLVCMRWRGIIAPAFVRDLFLIIRQEAFKTRNKVNGTQDVEMSGTAGHEDAQQWFALNAQAFGGKNGWTVLQFADRATLTWESER